MYSNATHIRASLKLISKRPVDWQRGQHYDAIIVIHILEHLLDPEGGTAQVGSARRAKRDFDGRITDDAFVFGFAARTVVASKERG
jgi:hypothetical protein